jgi:hypothetical protein
MAYTANAKTDDFAHSNPCLAGEIDNVEARGVWVKPLIRVKVWSRAFIEARIRVVS